jgi:PKD repeat protein
MKSISSPLKMLPLLALCISGKLLAQPKIITSATLNRACQYETISLSIQNPPANITSIQWDFYGNGSATTVSSGTQLQFYYNMSGAFRPKAIVNAPGGPFTIYADSLFIFNLPKADFVSTNGTKFCNQATVCFEDRSKPAIPLPGHPVDSLKSAIRLFGDGDFYNSPPTAANKNFCHSYPDPNYNTYTLTWRITDANGCRDSLKRLNYIYVVGNLGVQFSVNAPQGITLCPPVKYTNAKFFNLSQVSYPDSVKRFRWIFGDPNAQDDTTNWSQNGQLVHRYDSNSAYSPRLIVEEINGCRDTFIFNAAVKNTYFPWTIHPLQNPVCANPGKVCWEQQDVPGATKEWTFYVSANPVFNQATKKYTLGPWKPLSPDPKIFHETETFKPCRNLPCGVTITSLQIIPQGGNSSCPNGGGLLYQWDTVEVLGPKATIEIPGSAATAIADSERYQCKIMNTVHFPNNSCHYKAFNVVRLWDFGDKYARQCTTDTKKGINVSGNDTLSLLDPAKYPPGSGRPCNCNFSKDSLPSHTYTDWDTLALRTVNGNSFLSASSALYTSKNFPCYTAKLSLYDSVNKCGDSAVVQLALGPPKAGPAGSLLSGTQHTRVVLPDVNYSDPTHLKKSGIVYECMGSGYNGVVLDLSGTQPSCTRSIVAINYDSAAGISSTYWKKTHYENVNNQSPWSSVSSPRAWPNMIAHNYLDPPGLIDTNGWVTVGLVTGNGYGNKMCYDTAYYHKFIRFIPFNPLWDIKDALGNTSNSKIHDCVPMTIRGSIRDSIQDSISVIYWNWDDGSYDVDSIMRPGSKPGLSTYTRIHYVVNNKNQIVSQTDISNVPDYYTSLTYQHTYTKAGRYFPAATMINTHKCQDFYTREIVAGFFLQANLSDSVICAGDSLQLEDSSYAWYWPQPLPPNPDKLKLLQREWRILKRDTATGQNVLIDQINAQSPYYTFSSPGYYTIELIGKDSLQCKDTARTYVTVLGWKSRIFVPKPQFSSCDTVQLYDDSWVYDPYYDLFGKRTDSILPVGIPPFLPMGYDWEFGDGLNSDHLKNPKHNYLKPGKYVVSHTIHTYNGCQATAFDTVRINGPEPYFDIIPDSTGKAPLIVSFDNKSTSGAWYSWDFGDGSPVFYTHSDSNVSHTYTKKGTWCISLGASPNDPRTGSCRVFYYPEPALSTAKRCVTITSHVGVQKVLNAHDKIIVYPNPASDVLNIEGEADIKNAKLYIIDMTGRRHEMIHPAVKTNKLLSVPLQRLAPGSYVLELVTESGISHIRFIKE